MARLPRAVLLVPVVAHSIAFMPMAVFGAVEPTVELVSALAPMATLLVAPPVIEVSALSPMAMLPALVAVKGLALVPCIAENPMAMLSVALVA